MPENGTNHSRWKRGLNVEEKQKQRKEEHTQFQNGRRGQEVSKRRNLDDISEEESNSQDQLSDIERSVVEKIIGSLQTCDAAILQVAFTRHLSTYLTKETVSVIDDVIQAGLVARFLVFLEEENDELQCEAIKILVKIASGTETQRQSIISAGAVHKIYQLLASESVNTQTHAVHALGMLIGISTEIRKYVLDQGIVTALLELEDITEAASVRRYIAYCLAQLCQGTLPKDCPVLSLAKKLLHHKETELLEDTCWALVYLTRSRGGKPETAQTVLEQGIFHRLLELVKHESEHVSYTSLVVVCECMKIQNAQTLKSLGKLLPDLLHVLENSTRTVGIAACKTIAIITAGDEGYIQAVIDAYLFPTLIGILDCTHRINGPILIEATKALRNATVNGTAEHIQALVQMGCVQSLCGLLTSTECKVPEMVVDALRNILSMEEKNHKQHSIGLVKKYDREMFKKLPIQEHQKVRKKVSSFLNGINSSEEGEIMQKEDRSN